MGLGRGKLGGEVSVLIQIVILCRAPSATERERVMTVIWDGANADHFCIVSNGSHHSPSLRAIEAAPSLLLFASVCSRVLPFSVVSFLRWHGIGSIRTPSFEGSRALFYSNVGVCVLSQTRHDAT